MLCLFGPLDGKQLAIAQLASSVDIPVNNGDPMQPAAHIERWLYVKMKYRCNDDGPLLEMLVPEGTTERQIMERLIACYKP